MTELLLSFASVTLSMGVVAAVLLALAPFFKKRFTAQWRYWVWLVLALRLAVPFHLSGPRLTLDIPLPDLTGWAASQTPAEAAATKEPVPMMDAGEYAAGWEGAGEYAETWTETAVVEEAAVRGPARFDPALMLTLIWLGGAGAFLAFQWGRYAHLRRAVRRWGRPAGAEEYEALAETMDRAGASARVELIICPIMTSPALAGWVHPVILLPEDFTGEALSFALLHELTHLKRYDLWYKALLVWCNALHWFNPAMWLLRARAERDIEYACDEQVLRGRDEGFRRSYGLAILSAAAQRCPAAALTTHFTGDGKRLRARIGALLDMRPKRVGRSALGLVACAALLAGSLVACAPPGQNADAAATAPTAPAPVAATAAPSDGQAVRDKIAEIQAVQDKIGAEKAAVEDKIDQENAAQAAFDEAMKAASIRENLRSLDDITDTMMTGETVIGFESRQSSTNYLENGFVHSFGSYTGLTHQFVIHTDRAMDVELTYVTDFEEDAFKAAVITPVGEILSLEHSREDKTVTLSLPEGDNLVALAGYKAEGEFRIQAPPQDGVTFDFSEGLLDLL